MESAKLEYSEILDIDENNQMALTSLGILESLDENYEDAIQYLEKAREIMPFDPKINFNIGKVQFKAKEYLKAIDSFKTALEAEPLNMKILESLMISYLKIEKWDDLTNACRMILNLDKSNPKAIALLAKALKENKKYKDLEIFFDKIEEKTGILENKYKAEKNKLNIGSFKNKKNENILKNISSLKTKIRQKLNEVKKSKLIHHKFDLPEEVKEYSEMIGTISEKDHRNEGEETEIYNNNQENNVENDLIDPNFYLEELKKEPENPEIIFQLANYYFKKQEYKNSLEMLKKLLSLNFQGKMYLVYMKMGDIYYSFFKDIEQALDCYKKSVADKPNEISFIKIGRCYCYLNDIENEMFNYNKALEINKENEWGNYFMGCALAKKNHHNQNNNNPSRISDNHLALNHLKKSYDFDGTNLYFLTKYCEELSKSKNKKDLEMAIDILKSAKSNYPKKVEIHLVLSDAYVRNNEIEKGIEILEEANRNPEFFQNPDRLFKLGVIYERINDYNKALNIFKMVLVLKKDHCPSLCHVGFILASTKEFKRSLKYFKYATKVNPEVHYAYYGIAKIFQQIGNYDDALENYAISLEKYQKNYK